MVLCDLWKMLLKQAGSSTQFHPPIVWSCLNGSYWLTEAVRKIKHSYANIIISLGSMCVGGGDGVMRNLAISISTSSSVPSREVEVRYLLLCYSRFRRISPLSSYSQYDPHVNVLA